MSKCPYDPFDPAIVADPYPRLAEIRDESPAVFLHDTNLWLITRYADAKAILLDPQTYSNGITQKPLFPICKEAQAVLDEANFMPAPAPVGLTGSDAPVHTRLRRYVARAAAFTAGKMAQLEPVARETTNELIDRVSGEQSCDAVASFTAALPARIIYEFIGFPRKDHAQLRAWCSDRLAMFWGKSSVEEQCHVAKGLASYWTYCLEFAESDQAPGTLTGDLVSLRLPGMEPLSRLEIAGILFGLVFAGQESTANVLGELLHILLKDPTLWEALGNDRSKIPGAFEEALRIAPPLSAWRRITTKATSIGGVDIPAGAHILVHLGSAGHDAAVFPEPEVFDPRRSNANMHLAFGQGVHSCLGAPLSRMEARVLLNGLLDRIPTLRLVQPQTVEYVPNITFRGPIKLFVEWDDVRGVSEAT
jgi:cytochrome P450